MNDDLVRIATDNWERLRHDQNGNHYEASDEQLRTETLAGRDDEGAYQFVTRYRFESEPFEGDDDEAFAKALNIQLEGALKDMRRIVLDARRVIRDPRFLGA